MRISFNSAVPVDYREVGYGNASHWIYHSLLSIGHQVTLDNPLAPVQVCFMQPHLFRSKGYSNKTYNILYMPWESTEFRTGWVDILNGDNVDEVWTTSDWCAKWFVEAGVKKITKVFPHGIESDWKPKLRKRAGPVKYLIVDAEANRKGWQESFDAFREVFHDDPSKATLTIKTRQRCMARWKDDLGRFRNPADLPNVDVTVEKYSGEEMVQLFHDHDVLLYASCLSEDTEILTREGWKKKDEVFIGDIAATVNDKMELEYCLITDKFDYQVDEKLVSIKNASHDILVTKNHDMMVYKSRIKNAPRRKLKAKEVLEASEKTSAGAKWRIPVVPDVSKIPRSASFSKSSLNLSDSRWNARKLPENIPTASFYELLGWFIAEGSLYESVETGHKVIDIAQVIDANPEKYERIKLLAKDIGLNPIDDKIESSRAIRIYCTELFEFYSRCGHGALNKRIPREVLNLEDRTALEALFAGLVGGDGSGLNNSHNAISYYTSSIGLRDDFQELCFKLGYRTTVWIRPGETKTIVDHVATTGDNYMIGVAREFNSGTFKLDEAVSEIDYSGNVWCITTKNGTLISRRNGKISIMHNCGEGWGLIPFQMLATGGVAITTEEWCHYRDYLGNFALRSEYGRTRWEGEHPGNVCYIDQKHLVELVSQSYENFEEESKTHFKQSFKLHEEYDWVDLTRTAFLDIKDSANAKFDKQ